jgi:tripartite-type tricarboxylate transporter receptor subunit TctC
MKILVAVKQVAFLDDEFEMRDDGRDVDADFFEKDLNEFDHFSVEEAMLIKEAAGDAAEVVIAIVGNEDADDALRTALAKGADRGVRVWDDALAEADGVAVARVLAKVVEREKPDMVFTGAQSADFGSAVTGMALAGLLGWPHAAVVCNLDYKPGAGGSVGAEFVAKSPPDGYTLLVANTGTMVINPALYPKLPYTMLRDLIPVARTAQQPLALVVNPSVPANDIREFIAYVRRHPGKLNYASAGNGGISHLVPEMFKQAAGVFMVHLPYRGSAPAFADVLAGHAQVMAESIPQVTQYARQGKVRALAVTSRTRSPALPDVPTMIEAGLKDFEVVGFYGILAPGGTPKDVIARLGQAFQQTLETPEIRTRMQQQGADPAFLNPDAFGTFLKAELPRWERAVKASGAKID